MRPPCPKTLRLKIRLSPPTPLLLTRAVVASRQKGMIKALVVYLVVDLVVAKGAAKDLSHITYFNYNEKGHYATKCSESRKSPDPLDSVDSSSDAPGPEDL